jgi:membrane associated rhomboid family serine protease
MTFGGRLPWGVGLLLTLVVVPSLLVAFGDRHAGSLYELVALAPADVWRGQIWRLVTWSVIEPGPLGLILTCLFIYWLGRDLAGEWGSRRFLAVFGGVALTAAVATCLVALADAAVMSHRYLGGWELTTAMIVAWGLWFPHRIVRLFFLLPITGFWLAWLTIAVTVVYAVYMGWEGYLPELGAEGAILAWFYRPAIIARWTAARKAADDRRRRAERARRMARSEASLHLVEDHDEDDALPPEIEGQLRDIFEKGKSKPR